MGYGWPSVTLENTPVISILAIVVPSTDAMPIMGYLKRDDVSEMVDNMLAKTCYKVANEKVYICLSKGKKYLFEKINPKGGCYPSLPMVIVVCLPRLMRCFLTDLHVEFDR